MTSKDNLVQSDRDYIEAVWSSYFSFAEVQDGGFIALPDPQMDLRPFLNNIIPGSRETPWTSRSKSLIDHFRSLEPEFRGLPRISHLLACCIVCLRRNTGNQQALVIFNRILSEAGPDVTRHLNTRWLTSICDTIIDTSHVEVDRALAFAGTLFVSTIKMAETELRLYRPQRPWPPKTRLKHGGEIYDGVQSLWTEGRGDIDNILGRIESALKIESPVTPILNAIIARALQGNTFINRIIGTTGEKRLPIAPAEQLHELRRIMATL